MILILAGKPEPLYRKEANGPVGHEFGWAKSQPGSCEEGGNILLLSRIEPWFLRSCSSYQTLHRLKHRFWLCVDVSIT
jgi:hypothetical protein